MENIEMNQAAVALLAQWDPFQLGEDSYDTETADVVAALQAIDEVAELVQVIRQVYELSFEEWIAVEKCEDIARKLLALKQQIRCDL